MRYLLSALFILATVTTLFAQDLADLEAYETAIKPGAQLTYTITVKDKEYQLTATIKKLGDEMAFDWKTGDPDNKSGSVTMSANAIAKATALFHNFKGGESKLDNETCLWLSKKAQAEVNSTTQLNLKVNTAADTVTVLSNAINSFGFTLNGNFVTLSGWELQGGSPKVTVDVLESAKFPLIYRIDGPIAMVLTDIKNP